MPVLLVMLLAAGGLRLEGRGDAVAVSGDLLVVGGVGAVDVYARDGAGWAPRAHLDADGLALALSGETLAVGSDGAVDVFVADGEGWSRQAWLEVADERFGHAVALDGDVLVVGAPFADGLAGAAYVSTREGRSWSEPVRLTGSRTAPKDRFGHAVAVSGGLVVVGAPFEDDGAGAAYVFAVDGTLQARLLATNAEMNDRFGHAVAIDDGVIVVGALMEDAAGDDADDNSAALAGAAYVFKPDGMPPAYLKAPRPGVIDMFGGAVALSGDVIVVGAAGRDVGDAAEMTDAGMACVFTRDGEFVRELEAADAAPGAGFGASVAVSGDAIVVGASGAAYVFDV